MKVKSSVENGGLTLTRMYRRTHKVDKITVRPKVLQIEIQALWSLAVMTATGAVAVCHVADGSCGNDWIRLEKGV